ncbi:MAG TPA: tRNA preQ1(34) S-adenosylmethionine ribosyltransferase-isomerase QueA [Clostridiales bacterium]|nr:tRNA preQ1(34) S-adenosylmethionine ribosyltransferase-isomerase QueA [Clostridiales bacterium]
MKLSDFYYELPQELIAQYPLKDRMQSRLLVYDRKTKNIEHRYFKDIIEYLNPGDCLVINDTKVIPARLLGKREDTGGKMEFLLIDRVEDDIWEVMVNPGRRAIIGRIFIFGEGLLKGEILAKTKDGTRIVRFEYDGIFEEILDKVGIMPLPPYIHEELKDNNRYQTVYAKYNGSVAAPTAGLHFTQELLKQIECSGVNIANITLHVGIGTFRPVKTENIEDHHMHSESYYVSEETAEIVNKTREKGGRVIAVGTTSCRTLETIGDRFGKIHPGYGKTDIFIYPGYKFKVVDALITNFHLPQSTLLMLVSAFADREEILNVYAEAIEKRYRFFSFGDAMFIQ